MNLYDLPLVNACLNGVSTVLLSAGWWFIRNDRKTQHILCMIGAMLTSTVFLCSYLYYHAHAGRIHFTETGLIRPVYFFILLTHTVAAAVVLPLVIITLVPVIRRRWDKHRRIARWTMPVWLYVSVTGVLVYLMLYVWFPSAELATRALEL
jgi:putative membrane protein